MEKTKDFNIMDCALIAIATGEKAQNLRELSDNIKRTHPGCLYYHFWGGMLRPNFDDPEFQNDFASWTSRKLDDSKVSEQLALIDPNIFSNIEDLRTEVAEIIEQRLSELENVPWAKQGHEFHFVRSQIVIFNTGVCIKNPRELLNIIPTISLGSIFYHFIDSRRRISANKNDFSEWLSVLGEKYDQLRDNLDQIDPYFTTLNDLRSEINLKFVNFFKGGA
jgi:hypothetical protein